MLALGGKMATGKRRSERPKLICVYFFGNRLPCLVEHTPAAVRAARELGVKGFDVFFAFCAAIHKMDLVEGLIKPYAFPAAFSRTLKSAIRRSATMPAGVLRAYVAPANLALHEAHFHIALLMRLTDCFEQRGQAYLAVRVLAEAAARLRNSMPYLTLKSAMSFT